MRKKLIAGNWKMNLDWNQVSPLVSRVLSAAPESVDVWFFPPFPFIADAMDAAEEFGSREVIGAQNSASTVNGAFTGEVSSQMLHSMGVKYVLVGHSERRALFGETDEVLKAKIDRLIEMKMNPVFCVGETLDQRKRGEARQTVKAQIEAALLHLSGEQMRALTIAYEPVWAIGTGETATPEQAQEMHAFIRELLDNAYGEYLAASTRILYGGSMNADNAHTLLTQADVDGGLVGGASLKADTFNQIILAAQETN